MNRFESKDTAPASTTPAAIAAAADALATFACWYQGPNSHKADSTKFPKDNSDDLWRAYARLTAYGIRRVCEGLSKRGTVLLHIDVIRLGMSLDLKG